MRNEKLWAPSKYVMGSDGLRPSRDTRQLSISSRLLARLIADFYEKSIARYAAGKLLDLGCGTVPLYGLYRSHASEVTCVDWGNSPHEINHVDIAHDLTTPLPFDDACFDTIILSDVLEHLPEPQNLWREMARVLAPGGRVILNVPFMYWLHEEPNDFYRYTRHALRRFAENAGFEVLELASLGGAPEVVADVISKSVRLRRYGPRIANAVQRLCLWFIKTRVGKRVSQDTREQYPIGYGMVVQRSRACET